MVTRQPGSCAEAFGLVNSLIEGAALQRLTEWKKQYLKVGDIDESCGLLGSQYVKNFFRRNHEFISTKKAVCFDSKRYDWCRYEKNSNMYDGVYGQFHEMGIAEKLSEAVWRQCGMTETIFV
jgi:hypothetical protein